MYCYISKSFEVVTIRYHCLGGYKEQKFIFHIFVGFQVQDQGVSVFSSGEDYLLSCWCLSYAYLYIHITCWDIS